MGGVAWESGGERGTGTRLRGNGCGSMHCACSMLTTQENARRSHVPLSFVTLTLTPPAGSTAITVAASIFYWIARVQKAY